MIKKLHTLGLANLAEIAHHILKLKADTESVQARPIITSRPVTPACLPSKHQLPPYPWNSLLSRYYPSQLPLVQRRPLVAPIPECRPRPPDRMSGTTSSKQYCRILDPDRSIRDPLTGPPSRPRPHRHTRLGQRRMIRKSRVGWAVPKHTLAGKPPRTKLGCFAPACRSHVRTLSRMMKSWGLVKQLVMLLGPFLAIYHQ
jgi:hypothetical protein